MRKSLSRGDDQQVTRIPNIRPGDNVRVRNVPEAGELAGKLVLVATLCGALTQRDRPVVWRIATTGGVLIPVRLIERRRRDDK